MKQEKSLQKKYKEEVIKKIQEEFGIKNINAVPKIEKIVINSGLGEAKTDSSVIDTMMEEMELIAGQKPVVTNSKKAISNFKIRENMPIGVKVTLRKDKMWFFLDKLINIVLPRVKDFRGVSDRAFDGKGNYSLGLNDHMIFPEIDTSKVMRARHMQININTSANEDKQALFLLKSLGFPFKK
ncbi:MAG TPA: 50S ribosomal protein L5 [Candidatus Dojkabacteria bacterium]|jgi:large subunit ribosomal protein L5